MKAIKKSYYLTEIIPDLQNSLHFDLENFATAMSLFKKLKSSTIIIIYDEASRL